MIKSEDIKVSVIFTPGYQERYTAACLRVLAKRKNQNLNFVGGGDPNGENRIVRSVRDPAGVDANGQAHGSAPR